MRYPRTQVLWILMALLACLPVAAQTDSGEETRQPRRASVPMERLFLSFAEEAQLVDRQWWEGQLEFQDGSGFDATILRGVAAFQPWDDVEFGGSVGFGDTSVSGSSAGGSGATDLDLWAKYHFGDRSDVEYAAGGRLIVPTGDDSVGLGGDAFSFGVFGSLRKETDRLVFHGSAGVNVTGDGRIFGFNTQGETALTAAAGVVIPANERLGFVGEARYEGERFDGFDSATRLLGGINLKAGDGMFRAAIAFGLTDGAPDAQLIAGWAAMF